MNQSDLKRHSTVAFSGRMPWVGKALSKILQGPCVFMFHRILPRGERCYDPELATSCDVFDDFLGLLQENWRVLPLDQLLAERGKSGKSALPSCAITFDDGWIDNYLHAFPLLRKHQLPATVFLPVHFIGSNRRFWQEQLWLAARDLEGKQLQESIAAASRRFFWFPPVEHSFRSLAVLKRFLMTRPSQEAEEFVGRLSELTRCDAASSARSFMDWREVAEMQREGISFGSHTLNHPLLTHMEPSAAVREIEQSRKELGERLGRRISAFAYPWGAASPLTREAVRQSGYDFAFTTRPGRVTELDDPCMCPRIAVSNPILCRGASVLASGRTLFWFARQVRARSRPNSRKNGHQIRIAFIIDQITEWEGGTERQLHALIRALDRTYFEPELCFLFPTPQLLPDTVPCPARWLSKDKKDIPPSVVGRVFRLARLLNRTRPHIVQTFFVEGIFAGILAARLTKAPRILGSSRNAGYWKKLRHRIAFRSVAPLAHRWQCNSRTTWNYVKNQEGVSPERIDILPNAIDLTRFIPALPDERMEMRRQMGVEGAGPIFISVAALTAAKDLSTLLQAAKLLLSELPDAHYLIVGDGPLYKQLQQQTEGLGLSRVIHLVGRQCDVRPFLAAADFGVLTSQSEGSSNAVLEYMAMGLPSVISDIPANRELADGLFFTPGNAPDLARAMRRLLQDAVLRSDLRSQYLQTVKQFSLDKFVMRVQSYYAGMAAEIN
jgi:glycosyltransferase involved in cell wall biosynthesis/peptidoglycan/xylan/chitin deacetylase (PgdA/CDA1 family)